MRCVQICAVGLSMNILQDRLGMYRILFGITYPPSTLCETSTAPATVGPFSHSCSGWARFVRILLPGPDRTLHLQEVKVTSLAFLLQTPMPRQVVAPSSSRS